MLEHGHAVLLPTAVPDDIRECFCRCQYWLRPQIRCHAGRDRVEAVANDTATILTGTVFCHVIVNLELQHFDRLRCRRWRLRRQCYVTVQCKCDQTPIVHAIRPTIGNCDIAAEAGCPSTKANEQSNVLLAVNRIGYRRRAYAETRIVRP